MHGSRQRNSQDKRDELPPGDLFHRSHRRFVFLLSALYFSLWVALAIEPAYRVDWALENIVVLAGILILILTWKRYAFSRFSYILIAVFLSLHAIGSHYTYSKVPYREWIDFLAGNTIETADEIERNHYDRLVHFSYGLLLYYPFYECFLHFSRVRWRLWRYLVPLSFILSTSLIYELLEWAAAEILGKNAGIAFIGSQGDIWDAQKDSFAALVGAAITMTSMAIVFYSAKRDYPMEWNQLQSPQRKIG